MFFRPGSIIMSTVGARVELGAGNQRGASLVGPVSPDRRREASGAPGAARGGDPQEARALAPDSDLIFPDGLSGCVMSENRFLIARDALRYTKRCTPHGFRSSFRDWVSEETNFPSEVAEMALAHAIRSDVEAAYRRGKLLAKRRELMDAWAAFVAPEKVDPEKVAACTDVPA